MNPYTKMSYEDARAILTGGVYGILATAGEDGLPYGVPLTYAVQGNRLYFHGAGHGQKLKNIGEQIDTRDSATLRKYSILGALTLYLDFINLFLMLLRIMGNRR